jgi:hypothetical protein
MKPSMLSVVVLIVAMLNFIYAEGYNEVQKDFLCFYSDIRYAELHLC